ncbi:hypothetical protein ACOMHN_046800 [Nucella lapillus]
MNNFTNGESEPVDNSTSTNGKESFVEYQAALLLWKIWPPCILLLGGFGNIATIFVMHRIKDHHSSQHAILMALAMSDMLLLYTGALRMWLLKLFFIDMRLLHTVACKLHMWVVYSTSAASAWLVTTVTIQRTMAVTWPHKMKVICTLRRTWIAIAAVVCAVFALYFQVVPGKEIRENSCKYVLWYEEFYRQIFTPMDLFVSSAIPSACQLVCDAVLSWTLYKSFSSSSSSITSRTVSRNSTEDVNGKRKKTASRTTVMILTLSCAFLVLTMPINVCIIWYNYTHAQVSQSPRLAAIKELLYAVTFMMWYANSAVNFLLYCFTGTKFRRQFVNWIRCSSQDRS